MAPESSFSPCRMDFRLVWRSGAALGIVLVFAAGSMAFAAPHGGGGGRPMGGATAGAGHEAPRETLHEEARDEAKVADADGLGKLFAATPAQVRARFGDPDVSRSEGKGAFWTYRMPNCALFLFFQDGAKGLRVSGASTGPRKRGEPTPTVEACLAQAIETPE